MVETMLSVLWLRLTDHVMRHRAMQPAWQAGRTSRPGATLKSWDFNCSDIQGRMRPKILTWHDKFGSSEARALVPASDQ